MRGEWIEITVSNLATRVSTGLAPCGASGLKYKEVQRDGISVASLAPCGASGLKYVDGYVDIAWIKRLAPCGASGLKSSRSAPGADRTDVSPRAGRVD